MEVVLEILAILLKILGGVVGYLLLCIVVFIISSLLFDHNKNYQKDSSYYRFIMNSMTGLVLFVMRIKIEVTGLEKLPNERFLLVGNHVSNWDPIVTWFSFRKKEKLAYVSKISNLKIPFFGWVSKKMCFLPIDRTSIRRSAETFDEAAELIKNNVVSVGIYPEGTRSKTGNLGKFHNAVFKVAQMANSPIVIVKAIGTADQKHNFPLKKTVVKLDIVGVLSTEEVQNMKTSEISDIVREKLENN